MNLLMHLAEKILLTQPLSFGEDYRSSGVAAPGEAERPQRALSQMFRSSKCCAPCPMAGSGNAAAQHRRGSNVSSGPVTSSPSVPQVRSCPSAARLVWARTCLAAAQHEIIGSPQPQGWSQPTAGSPSTTFVPGAGLSRARDLRAGTGHSLRLKQMTAMLSAGSIWSQARGGDGFSCGAEQLPT